MKKRAYAFDDDGIYHLTRYRGGLASNYDHTITNGDFAVERISANGQKFVELSIDPLTDDHESVLTYQSPMRAPFTMAVPFAISQRARNSYFSLEAVDLDTPFENIRTLIAIASISQATTTLTIVLTEPCNLQRDERFHVYGLVDSRLNYSNVTVATLSTDRKTITATVADDGTITSATVAAVNNSGYIVEAISSISNANGMAWRFSGGSATAAACIIRGSGTKPRKSGTLGGADTVTAATTAPIIGNGGNGQFEIRPTSCFELILDRGIASFEDYATDSSVTTSTVRNIHESASPDTNVQYTPQLRSISPKSMSRPIAKIVSAVKSGSTVATITTDVAHGLVSGNIVDLFGIRDQTNFVQFNTLTVTVLSETTFTVSFGTSYTGTSYGGVVILRNGNASITGASVQAIQSVSIDNYGILSVTGNTTWSGITVGEYVQLHGVRNATNGADMGLDGAYVLIDLTTNIIKLKAVTDLDGVIVKDGNGVNVTPTLAPMVSTNCGGSVIMRTTARIHDMVVQQFNYQAVKIDGQGTTRLDKAVPVLLAQSANMNEIGTLAPSVSTLTTAATTNATSVKTTAGNVFSLDVTNTSASVMYLKLYNKTSAPTVGTDIPIATIPIPATSFQSFTFGRLGKRFASGIAFALTGAMVATDTTAVAAGSYVNINYI